MPTHFNCKSKTNQIWAMLMLTLNWMALLPPKKAIWYCTPQWRIQGRGQAGGPRRLFLDQTLEIATDNFTFQVPVMSYTILYHNRSFSHGVTAAIFVNKTMDRRPCLCTKKILWELNSFHMLKLSFIPSNLQSCWPPDRKRSKQLYMYYIYMHWGKD